MIREEVQNEYFDWMYYLIFGRYYSDLTSYQKLLIHLHRIEFTWSIPKDVNRASDGIELRRRFSIFMGYDDLSDYLDGPCSVLEMMVALAIRCEEDIMDDPIIGNRTGQWFFGMIRNLGLGSMTDANYDEQFVDSTIRRFINRDYEPNGKGGLFTVRNYDKDLRDVEIWIQMLWYLDDIT